MSNYARRTRSKIFFNIMFLSMAVGICGFLAYTLLRNDGPDVTINVDFQQQLINKISNAKNGERIEVPAGRYQLDQGLLLTKEGITLAGAGSARTQLSFLAMEATGPAIHIDADNITVSGMTILDAKDTGVLISTSDKLIVHDIETNAPGADRDRPALGYGMVIRRSSNVIVSNSRLMAGRNAGIYILDSDNVLIKNNKLTTNTIGLQVVSSRSVDVIDSTISHNSMGVLLAEFPTQALKPGRNIRLHGNTISANNRNNFRSSAEVAQLVFTGVGLHIAGVDKVEVFRNTFRSNNASNIVIFGNEADSFPDLFAFDPYAEGIYIVDNEISDSGMAPGNLANWRGINLSLPYPDILYDGVISPSNANSVTDDRAPDRVCLNANRTPRIVNLDLDDHFGGRSRVIEKMECKLARLPKQKLPLEMLERADSLTIDS